MLFRSAAATGTDLHHRQGRRRSLRPSWERPLLHLPRVLRRPRSLTGSPTRVTSSRNALTARTKRYGLTSRSTGLKTQLSAACLLLRGQLTCLPSCPRWATRDGKLPAQPESDFYAVTFCASTGEGIFVWTSLRLGVHVASSDQR